MSPRDAASGRTHPDPAVGHVPGERSAVRPWRRYVAVGDSFTEGMCDADPTAPDRYVGWADRLAMLLAAHSPGFGYANLAVRGRKLDDIAGRQVDEALRLEPDLVSIVGGGNDILRPRADLDALAAQLEAAVARLRASGADVLLATPTDPKGAPIIERTRGRAATYAAHIWTIAGRHGCFVLNQWGCAWLKDWRMWAPDRIHMASEAHRRMALAAYEVLGHPADEADWQTPLPPQPPPDRIATLRSDARWAREHAAPWVRRRLRGHSSGDGLAAKRPGLAPLTGGDPTQVP